MRRRLFLGWALGAAALAAAGCQSPQAAVSPEGEIAILDNLTMPLAPGSLPEDWVVDGPRDLLQGRLSRSFLDGYPALRVESGPTGFAAVRRTRAILLATPYLTWAWNAEPHGPKGHAAYLLVGFKGGRGDGRSLGGLWPGGDLPEHDRLLAIAWGGSALQRGALHLAHEGQTGEPARYTARGGRENAGIWFREAVDLQDLYGRAWPGDDRNAVRIVFVGVAAAAGQLAAAMNFSGIMLAR